MINQPINQAVDIPDKQNCNWGVERQVRLILHLLLGSEALDVGSLHISQAISNARLVQQAGKQKLGLMPI